MLDISLPFNRATTPCTEEEVREASSNGRVFSLKIRDEQLRDWDVADLQWIESKNDTSLPERAVLLPQGWSVGPGLEREDRIEHACHGMFAATIRDEDNVPRAETCVFNTASSTSLFTKEEGLRRRKEEQSLVARKQEILVAKAEAINQILQSRSDMWSIEYPFAVFYIKNMAPYRGGGYASVLEPIRRACHGFFPTAEIAEKAAKFFEENASKVDTILIRKIDRIFPHFIVQNGDDVRNPVYLKNFRVVNGYTDKTWYAYPLYRWIEFVSAADSHDHSDDTSKTFCEVVSDIVSLRFFLK